MTLRVGVLGATGYGGGELLRLLLRHPHVEVALATSRSKAGVSVGAVHRNLDRLTDLTFSSPDDDAIAASCDLVFGALPHGASAERLAPLVARGVRVVDLSGDFRLRDLEAYRRWYRREHPHPELLGSAVYGSPELQRDRIRGAKLVASPGCFATAIELALLPMAEELAGTPRVVAMTASSGSGAEASAGTHHPTRAGTLRPYKVLAHQHVPEIVQALRDAGSTLDALSFIPVSAPLVRGILAVVSVPLRTPTTTEAVAERFASFYASHPFLKVLTEREPECGSIAGTNFVEVRARMGEDGWMHSVVALDNLVKGGAGQGVQNMNLVAGFEETAGLQWPGMWP